MSVFEFDGFRLDPGGLRLQRDGEEVSVEPRVLEVLVFLVENRERVVSKDELIESIWKGAAVSDAAISRCIYQVRRALGDTSKPPRFVGTIRGRGFRFLAELDDLERLESVESVESVESESQLVADTAQPWSPLRRLLMIGAALLVVGFGVIALRVSLRQPSGEPAGGRSVIAILPFGLESQREPQSNAVGSRVALVALLERLVGRLEDLDGVDVRQAPVSGLVSDTDVEPELFVKQIPASVWIHGTFGRGDSGFGSVSVFATKALADQALQTTPIGSYPFPDLRTESGVMEFLQLRDVIAKDIIRNTVSLAKGVVGDDRDTDPEAYRLYLLAREEVLDNLCEGGRAVELLDQALDVDPDLAEAWQLLGETHYNHAWACGHGMSALNEARAALSRAGDIRPGWIEPRLLRVSLLVEAGQAEQGYAEALELESLFPEHPWALELKSYALRYAGFVGRSVELYERARELNPLLLTEGTTGESPTPYLYALDIDEFEAVLPTYPSAYIRYYRSLAALLRGDEESALRLSTLAYRSSPEGVFGQFARAMSLALEGDLAGARVVVESMSRQRTELEALDGEIDYKQAQLLALAGDDEGALQELDLAVERGFFCARCLLTDPLLDDLRGSDGFTQVVERAVERHLAFAERFGLEPETTS